MRLIDADALLEGREDHEMISTHLIWNAPTIDAVEKERYDRLLENSIIIADALRKYQSADMVEVVQCKDCKWFDPSHPCGTIEPLVFKCRLYGTFHSPGFFCGSGERRKSWEDPSHPCADSVMMGD